MKNKIIYFNFLHVHSTLSLAGTSKKPSLQSQIIPLVADTILVVVDIQVPH